MRVNKNTPALPGVFFVELEQIATKVASGCDLIGTKLAKTLRLIKMREATLLIQQTTAVMKIDVAVHGRGRHH